MIETVHNLISAHTHTYAGKLGRELGQCNDDMSDKII